MKVTAVGARAAFAWSRGFGKLRTYASPEWDFAQDSQVLAAASCADQACCGPTEAGLVTMFYALKGISW